MNKSRIIAYSSGLMGFVALCGWLVSVQAHRVRNFSVQEYTAQEKIAPWLQMRLADTQQEIEFLVVLKEQADLSSAALLETKEAKGRYVRKTLWQTAQNTQAPLIAWLKEKNAPYRSFYILNALWVKGTRTLATEIAARPEVARVEGNPLLNFTQPVEAPVELSDQLLSPEQATAEPGINYIHANELWKEGFTGQGIVIGGQDTGVEWSHPALQARYRGSNGETTSHDYNWHDSVHNSGSVCGADAAAPCDDNGHGTHTVGTSVGTNATNQIGVAPGSQFIACRNMDRGNGTPATYLECFEFMLAPYPVKGSPEQGDPSKAPDLTLNSWSCPPSEGCAPDTLRLAIEAQHAAGIMTIVAAGNEGPGCSTINAPPGNYDTAYAIGAVDANSGLIASFSSRGPVTISGNAGVKPDISAPGVFVRSAYRSGTYAYLSGTSMATPHVAGAIALLWSARPELKNQIALTESLLNEAATPVQAEQCGSTGIPNFVYGHGRLDIKAAYDLATAAIELSATTVNQQNGEINVRVMAPSSLKWRVINRANWLSLSGASEFTGSAIFVLRVAENTGLAARSSVIQIAGRNYTITQAGTDPFTVSGLVVDINGIPQPRVRVTFVREDYSNIVPGDVTTDEEGRWTQTGFTPGPAYRALASRGRVAYTPYSYTFSAPLTTLNFVEVNRRIVLPFIR